MKQMKGFFVLLCSLIFLSQCIFWLIQSNRPKKGIVVAVNDNYAHNYFIASLSHLRENLDCKLPIEVWHSGDELSKDTIDSLNRFQNLSFHDIAAVLNVDPAMYRGFQIKPKIIELSQFDDILLIDADVFFFENPDVLFDTPAYLNTGTFFFSDLPHTFPVKGDKVMFTLDRYLDRRHFIQSLVSKPSPYVLSDMKEMWTNTQPTVQAPYIGDMQESGCVAFNKKKHKKSLDRIIGLNDNLDDTYQHIYGDKETFWLGCEMAEAPYYMNKQRPLTLLSGADTVTIMQFLNDKLFFQQKNPIAVRDKNAAFIKYARQFFLHITGQEPSKIQEIRKLTLEEENKIEAALEKSRSASK